MYYNRYNLKDIMSIPIENLYEWYEKEFIKIIPNATDIGLNDTEIGDLLTKYANSFVYFDYLCSCLESKVRELKADKLNPDRVHIAEYTNKRDALEHFAEQMKFSYTALSRICTVKIESNKELMMLNEI